jgi:hypothetical protein
VRTISKPDLDLDRVFILGSFHSAP